MDEMQDKEMNTPLADEPQGGTLGEAEPERPAAAPEEAQKPAPPSLRAHFARLCAEADALHRADPDFDLDSALRDPAFVRLTAPDVGVPVADAWYALHRREYADALRRDTGDAGVDLVKNQHTNILTRRQDVFERQHDARQLAAGCDLTDAAERLAGVCRDQKAHIVRTGGLKARIAAKRRDLCLLYTSPSPRDA